MSRHDVNIEKLEAGLLANRIRLSGTVSDVAARLKPRNLANAALDQIAGKAAHIAKETLEVAKDNAGKATLVGAGALLAFDLGRVAGRPSETEVHLDLAGEPASSPVQSNAAQGWSAMPSLAGGFAAAGLGYVVGLAIPVTKVENDLLGHAPGEFRSTITRFWQEHQKGAKLSIANSFGVARWAAAGLGLMAAAALIIRPNSTSRP